MARPDLSEASSKAQSNNCIYHVKSVLFTVYNPKTQVYLIVLHNLYKTQHLLSFRALTEARNHMKNFKGETNGKNMRKRQQFLFQTTHTYNRWGICKIARNNSCRTTMWRNKRYNIKLLMSKLLYKVYEV